MTKRLTFAPALFFPHFCSIINIPCGEAVSPLELMACSFIPLVVICLGRSVGFPAVKYHIIINPHYPSFNLMDDVGKLADYHVGKLADYSLGCREVGFVIAVWRGKITNLVVGRSLRKVFDQVGHPGSISIRLIILCTSRVKCENMIVGKIILLLQDV